MKRWLAALCLFALCLPFAALAEFTPYLQRITRPDEPIFDGPGYDAGYVSTVREAGVYTIVGEALDEEGNLWGRLKSGAGWVDLTHVRSPEEAALPISAGFAEDEQLTDECCCVVADDSEYALWIIFHAYETLRDVRLMSLDVTDYGLAIGEQLSMLPEMSDQTPLAARVSFPGDMSAYGIAFEDRDGARRFFVVSISGRNGMLVLEELMIADTP